MRGKNTVLTQTK